MTIKKELSLWKLEMWHPLCAPWTRGGSAEPWSPKDKLKAIPCDPRGTEGMLLYSWINKPVARGCFCMASSHRVCFAGVRMPWGRTRAWSGRTRRNISGSWSATTTGWRRLCSPWSTGRSHSSTRQCCLSHATGAYLGFLWGHRVWSWGVWISRILRHLLVFNPGSLGRARPFSLLSLLRAHSLPSSCARWCLQGSFCSSARTVGFLICFHPASHSFYMQNHLSVAGLYSQWNSKGEKLLVSSVLEDQEPGDLCETGH